MREYYILPADCLAALKKLPENSVDSMVTDPPYGWRFMGKAWDVFDIALKAKQGKRPGDTYIGADGVSRKTRELTAEAAGKYDLSLQGNLAFQAWTTEWAREVYRVLKPGGHILVFCGPRTYHRMASGVEDAGFEIRDQMQWLFGSGFPKSLDVSKQLDKEEQRRWLDISKAVDNLDISDIIKEWIRYSNAAKYAAIRLKKSVIETGTNTLKSDFVHVNVVPPTNLEKSKLNALIAELKFSDHLHISNLKSIVLGNVEASTIQLQEIVKHAGNQLENPNVMQSTHTFSAQCDVKELLKESTPDSLKAVEVLKTWLGSNKSSREADTSVLCVALIEDLKLTILNQSKTFQGLDTKSQMDFASAISVTITESTAENLISFTAGILKSKAIDKAAGAEREVVGHQSYSAPDIRGNSYDQGHVSERDRLGVPITQPATAESKLWQGFGTALKPANEPILLARKPLSEKTVAANVLKHGTGGINIDGCRIGTEVIKINQVDLTNAHGNNLGAGVKQPFTGVVKEVTGRFPANLVLSHNEDCSVISKQYPVGYCTPGCAVAMLDEQSGTSKSHSNSLPTQNNGGSFGGGGNRHVSPNDSGGASRFFYVAKASKSERNLGCEGLPEKIVGSLDGNIDHEHGNRKIGARPDIPTVKAANNHPTVKPLKLMRYLCRLITPPNGIILDPFMGSGSTGIAALSEGFSFIGIEREQEYFKIALSRLRYTYFGDHSLWLKDLKREGVIFNPELLLILKEEDEYPKT